MSALRTRLAAVALCAATAAVAVLTLLPPGDAGGFPVDRVRAHVREIAAAPRPTGSPAHDAAREYLVRQLRDLGLDPQVRTAPALADAGHTPYGTHATMAAARVRNVVARIPGTDSTGTVVLMTHYDTVPTSPGANDAGVPVGVLLETARALLLGDERPRNDVLLVFTDAEEAGLLGAKAFLEHSPPDPERTVVLNVEARGSTGPVLLFESGRDSGWLLPHVAAHVRRPLASSLFQEAYRHLPNHTDFTLLKEAGYAGFNLAHVHGLTDYHGATDTPDNTDPATIAHHGSYALGLGRALAGADLTAREPGDPVHFTVAGVLVRYPPSLAVALAAAQLAAVAALGVTARRRGLVTIGRAVSAAALWLLSTAVAAGLTTALAALVGTARPEFREYGDLTANLPALLGFALLALAATTTAAAFLHRRLRTANAVAGALLLWTALSAVTAVALPGASYAFTWPAAAAVAAAALLLTPTPVRRAAAAVLLVVPTTLVIVPLAALVSAALGTALVAAALVLPVLWLCLAPVVAPAALRTAAALAGAVALALVAVPTGPTARYDDLALVADPATGRALWVTMDDDPPPWIGRHVPPSSPRGTLPDLFPGWTQEFAHAPAPAGDLPAPQATLTGDEVGGGDGTRTLTYLIRSPRGAPEVLVLAPGTRVRAHSVDGTPPATPPEGAWELWIRAVPPEGVTVSITVDAGAAPTLHVLDRTWGTPAHRPPEHHPAPALGVRSHSNATYVHTLVEAPRRGGGDPAGGRSDSGG